jgi:hypothetical protein
MTEAVLTPLAVGRGVVIVVAIAVVLVVLLATMTCAAVRCVARRPLHRRSDAG